MTTRINGLTGVDLIKDGTVVQQDLSAGVAGNGPAFAAWQSVAQSGLPMETHVKMAFTTEVFDTNGGYDPTTSRFTPKVAGYYLIIGGFSAFDLSETNSYLAAIYKNGSQVIGGSSVNGNNGAYAVPRVTGIVYMNGSTDYVEIYGYSSNKASWSTVADQVFRSLFQAALVRAA